MILGVIGTLIGAMVTGFGLYYLVKEKDDVESKKIYTVITLIGAVIFAVMLLRLIVSLG